MRHTTIGVDVAKDHLDACRLPNREVRRFPNTKQGRDALVRWIGKGAERVVFEPTGHYARPLERKLHLAGLPAVKVNPARARRFAEAAGLLAKTDRIDAEMLARMGRQLDIAPTPPLSPDIETLKELRLARRALDKDRQDRRQEPRKARHPHGPETTDRPALAPDRTRYRCPRHRNPSLHSHAARARPQGRYPRKRARPLKGHRSSYPRRYARTR